MHCRGPECTRPAEKRGLCDSHYWQSRHKPSLTALRPRGISVDEWIVHNSLPADASGCIIWKGWTHHGYAALQTSTGRVMIHQHLMGQPPAGMTIDHKCRRRNCVNRGHLRFIPDPANAQNRTPRSGVKSGHRGVTQQKNGTWQARCMVDGKTHSLGTYKTIEEAAAAASEGRKRLMPYAIEGQS